jgi:dTDP-4-amino-4,6-dideoxygalactose transaminase
LYGQVADMDALLALGVPVLEDACQAIGARYGSRQAGGLGVAGCFSFFPSKNLGAFGDAGLIATNDAHLADELRLLRNHGAQPKYYHSRIGGNFRMDALQAAVLRVKAPHLAGWTAGRRRNAARYRELFADAGLDGVVTLPLEANGRTHIFNQFVIAVSRRDELRHHLAERGVSTEIYYPVPFHRQACFSTVPSATAAFPVADAAAARTLALPIYPELTDDQLRHVVASIRAFYA